MPQGEGTKDPELIDAAGYQKILAEHKGQPLLVTFWATWCEPCRAEYPMLNELAKQYAPQGLKVVGVNLDDDGDIISTRRFMARYKPVFPNYRKKAGGETAFVDVVMAGWSGAIPASFFYDAGWAADWEVAWGIESRYVRSGDSDGVVVGCCGKLEFRRSATSSERAGPRFEFVQH